MLPLVNQSMPCQCPRVSNFYVAHFQGNGAGSQHEKRYLGPFPGGA